MSAVWGHYGFFFQLFYLLVFVVFLINFFQIDQMFFFLFCRPH